MTEEEEEKEEDVYVALVSGLGLGRPGADALCVQLLVDFHCGFVVMKSLPPRWVHSLHRDRNVNDHCRSCSFYSIEFAT